MTYRIAKAHPDSLFFLPRDVLRTMEDAGDRELRILLHSLSLLSQGPQSEEVLTEALRDKDFYPDEIRSALSFWRGCGILKGQGKEQELPKQNKPSAQAMEDTEERKEAVPATTHKAVDEDEAPFYSALELSRAAEENSDFKNLVDYAQKKLNKIFNTSELAKLWSFLDYLKLPTEVVMLVIEDCYNREKTGLRYITKVLNSFHDAGIDSYEKAEAYFVAKEEAVSFQRFVRRLFGLGERKLTRAEEETLSQWQGWAFSEEMLNLAYEKTVASAKNPSIAYMHRILESWHKQGFTSPAETEESRTASGGKAEKSFDSDDFFQAAVAKGLKNI